ncbi:hypothetical protein [Agromyces bauzanensis]
MTSQLFLIVLGWLLGIGISMGILYAVIYSAVLAALRKARAETSSVRPAAATPKGPSGA